MTSATSVSPTAVRRQRVLCAPYHLYTHWDVLAQLLPLMRADGWHTDMLLPFSTGRALDAMAEDARRLPGLQTLHDFTWRRAVREGDQRTVWRIARAIALLVYFVRTAWLAWRTRPELIVLTTDLGGISVRFLQLCAVRLGLVIVTIQATLFLRVEEREDLKYELRPRWLNSLLSRGVLRRLFLYFGEVPGSFLPQSYLAVQDDEIGTICMAMGRKPADRIQVIGSLQAAAIRAARRPRRSRPRVLLLTECMGERFGEAMAMRYVDWLHAVAVGLSARAEVTVRFHPRESEDFRQRLQERFGTLFVADTAADAIGAAGRADVIVGAFSMLMFDAQSAGVPVVFMDAGSDPIGFYGSRRRPLARSKEELVHLVSQALLPGQGEAAPTASASDSPQAWARALLTWLEGLPQRRTGSARHR